MSANAPYTPQDFDYPLILEDYISVSSPLTHAADACAACHTPGAKNKCSKCKNIRYCSSVCQKHDWITSHKLVCKTYVKATRESIRDPMRRVLYFPENSTKPVFSILAFDEKGTVGGLEHYFPGIPAQEIKKLSFHNRYLPYFVQINYDSNVRGERALAENKSFGLPFRGPVVVVAYDLETALSGPALHANTTIMGPLMAYIKLCREYDGPRFIEQPQQRYTKAELEDIMGRELDNPNLVLMEGTVKEEPSKDELVKQADEAIEKRLENGGESDGTAYLHSQLKVRAEAKWREDVYRRKDTKEVSRALGEAALTQDPRTTGGAKQVGAKYKARSVQEVAERGKIQASVPELDEKAKNNSKSKGGSRIWNAQKEETAPSESEKKGPFERAAAVMGVHRKPKEKTRGGSKNV